MAKPRNDFLDRLAYIGFRVISMMVHCWPINLNLRAAKFLGDILYRLDRKHRERALANLRRSFPELSEPQIDHIARRGMQTLFMFFVEVLYTTRLVRVDTWTRYVELENFHGMLDILLRKERGLIMLTGHYGNFEICNYMLTTLGFQTVAVGRPLDNPYVNEWMMSVRERQGGKIISKKGATEEVSTALDRKGVVGFVADQNAGRKGIFVDFFGRKASTYKSIGLLAMEYNVPIVIGYARRINDEFRFAVGVQDIIQPQDWADQPDPLLYITQRYTTALENLVRKDPGQYWWVHRRWKTRPKGEEPAAYD